MKTRVERCAGVRLPRALGVLAAAAVFGLACASDPATDESTGDPTDSDTSDPSESSEPGASDPVDSTAGETEGSSSEVPATSGTDTGAGDDVPAVGSGVCARDQRLGTFTLYLEGDKTLFSGSVYDSINPLADFAVLGRESGCELLGPRVLSCEPACPNGETCAGDNTCVPKPAQVSAGSVNLTGLAEPWEVTPNGITRTYSGNRSEPSPGFERGDTLGLTAEGADFPAFTLSSWGVAALQTDLMLVPVASGSPVNIAWDASNAAPEQSKVLVTLTVNVHGSTTQWIECFAEDDGALEIPASLVTELVDLGLSGFPIVEMQRLSASSVSVDDGCVDFRVSSGKMAIPLDVEGLVSCNDTTPCPDDLTCTAEKICAAP